MAHGIGHARDCALLQAGEQLALHVVAPDLPAIGQFAADGVRGGKSQGPQGVVAQAGRIERGARRVNGQHCRRGQAATERMASDSHVTLSENFFRAFGKSDGLLVLPGRQSKALAAIGHGIATFTRTPVVGTPVGHHVLALLVLVDGGVKPSLRVVQQVRRDGDLVALGIYQAIAHRSQPGPTGLGQFTLGLGAGGACGVQPVGVVCHQGELQVQLGLRRGSPHLAGEAAIANWVPSAGVHRSRFRLGRWIHGSAPRVKGATDAKARDTNHACLPCGVV